MSECSEQYSEEANDANGGFAMPQPWILMRSLRERLGLRLQLAARSALVPVIRLFIGNYLMTL